MPADLDALAARQDGLMLRRQVLDAGVTPETIGRYVRQGSWTVVRRGVYLPTAQWSALDDYRGRPLIRARAATLNMRKHHVWSHRSAGLALNMALLDETPDLVHVTRPGVSGSRTEHGVKHHLAPYADTQILTLDGYEVLDHARTAVDIAREKGVRHGIVACDSAMAFGVSRAELEAAVEPMVSWPGVTSARRAVELADPDVDSPGESLSRLLAHELGLTPVETQFGLSDGRRTVWCDLRVRRHIIEFDGRKKFRQVAEGGVANIAADEVLWQEKQRQDFVTGFKLGMSRLIWDDLLPRNWTATGERVLREVADTDRRFGTSIVDLAPFVVRKVRNHAA